MKSSAPSSRYSSGEEEKPRETCSREGQLNNVNVSATHAPLQERCNYNNARTKDMIDTSGIEEDTKQLEWILKRLVEKLQPLTNENEPEGVTPKYVWFLKSLALRLAGVVNFFKIIGIAHVIH
jgi:hypothetical protein